MDSTGLQEFLALTEARTEAEIAHVLAVVTATTQHMDQQKEHQMPSQEERQTARTELHKGNAEPALAFNRQCRDEAQPGQCGGCIGAGTGTHCCMCGLPR